MLARRTGWCPTPFAKLSVMPAPPPSRRRRPPRVVPTKPPTEAAASTAGKPKRKAVARTRPAAVRKRAEAPGTTAAALRTPRRWTWPLRALRRFARLPGFLQFGLLVLLVVLLVPTVNWLYQVVRKPTELFFPVSGRLFKTPGATWAAYAPLFRAHSTAIMTPGLLAALAQSEASGNPVARTYWRWQATTQPFDIYRPASSAVGMYQFTDGTFDEARGWCVHDHRVVADGPWHAWDSCWFNTLYSRVVPSHAVELAASNLDRRVRETLARRGITASTLRQQQQLAIVTHLCGAGAASRFAAQGLRPTPGQRCGTHDLAHYIARVEGYKKIFDALHARDASD